VALGPPVLGPLGRIALGGRNWETYSNDPYLTGALGAEAVKGVQDNGVISCTKVSTHDPCIFQPNHSNVRSAFCWERAGNAPKPTRGPDTNTTIEASSSNIDDRTMHEHYMWPFADAVHAGTASISTFSLTLSHLAIKAHPLLTALLPSVCIRETEQ
jgi:beta-glucosidase